MADHPSLFIAPALRTEPSERALLVLKRFLCSLRNQQYAGRSEADGVKKPLNAFLGELFLGKWENEEIGTTRLVAEQVSHHPPITACYFWNEKHGVRTTGFAQQEITFSGSVSIKQKGYAIFHIDRYDEDYLIPMPNVKVKSIVSGTPYPELTGRCSIISSTGFVAEVTFEAKGWITGGTKNGFHARVFHTERPKEDLYTVKGTWNTEFIIEDARTGETVEKCNVAAQKSIPVAVDNIENQDPWESRRAWKDVVGSLEKGDMKATAEAKSIVENGQRQMRQEEKDRGVEWKPLFFRRQQEDVLFEKLSRMDKDSFAVDAEGGIWKVDLNAIKNVKKPYHGGFSPTGSLPNPVEGNVQMKGTDGFVAESNIEGKIERPNSKAHKERTSGPTNDATDKELREKIQVEEFLRNKYSSNPR